MAQIDRFFSGGDGVDPDFVTDGLEFGESYSHGMVWAYGLGGSGVAPDLGDGLPDSGTNSTAYGNYSMMFAAYGVQELENQACVWNVGIRTGSGSTRKTSFASYGGGDDYGWPYNAYHYDKQHDNTSVWYGSSVIAKLGTAAKNSHAFIVMPMQTEYAPTTGNTAEDRQKTRMGMKMRIYKDTNTIIWDNDELYSFYYSAFGKNNELKYWASIADTEVNY